MMDINMLSVLIATVAGMAVGFVWYSKAIFGKQWMKLAKMSEADTKKGDMTQIMIFSTLGTLVSAFVLALLLNATGTTEISGALTLAFLVWLGFVVPVTGNDVLYARKPRDLFFLNAAHALLTLVVMVSVLILWP